MAATQPTGTGTNPPAQVLTRTYNYNPKDLHNTKLPTEGLRRGVPKLPIGDEPIEDPVVPRDKWGALESRRPLEERSGPINRVLVTYTKTESCETEKTCIEMLQDIQNKFIKEKGDVDLPYNFIVGGDGKVYEGRGWKFVPPTPKWVPDSYDDGRSLIIAFIGDYSQGDTEPEFLKGPTEEMVQARRSVVRYGVENDLLSKDIDIVTTIPSKI